MQHIARDGEQEFACIKRNRSEQDSDEIGYGIRVQEVERLSRNDKYELLKAAEMMLKTIRHICWQNETKQLAAAALELARHASKASLESLGHEPDLAYPDVDERGEHETAWEAWSRQLSTKIDLVRELSERH